MLLYAGFHRITAVRLTLAFGLCNISAFGLLILPLGTKVTNTSINYLEDHFYPRDMLMDLHPIQAITTWDALRDSINSAVDCNRLTGKWKALHKQITPQASAP
jgi:hypothetical protein